MWVPTMLEHHKKESERGKFFPDKKRRHKICLIFDAIIVSRIFRANDMMSMSSAWFIECERRLNCNIRRCDLFFLSPHTKKWSDGMKKTFPSLSLLCESLMEVLQKGKKPFLDLQIFKVKKEIFRDFFERSFNGLRSNCNFSHAQSLLLSWSWLHAPSSSKECTAILWNEEI